MTKSARKMEKELAKKWYAIGDADGCRRTWQAAAFYLQFKADAAKQFGELLKIAEEFRCRAQKGRPVRGRAIKKNAKP